MLFSEPKIPQLIKQHNRILHQMSFSALQRAENSSIKRLRRVGDEFRRWFQCSSASRKFLNAASQPARATGAIWFQCSSASRKFLNNRVQRAPADRHQRVSVLFSEPKIPQSYPIITVSADCTCFSALQRAENSSIVPPVNTPAGAGWFQCSSASRKFLNPDPRTCVHPYFRPR